MRDKIKELEEKLLRKERECGGWKNRSDGWMSKCEQETKLREFIDEQLKRKERELEQEKTLKEMYFTYYKAKHSDIKGEFFRYKQVLIKIKDFVENEMVPNSDTHIILQLISEVDDDRQD